MKNQIFKYHLISVLFLVVHLSGFGQSPYTLNDSESNLLIKGTSSVHDWEIGVTEFTTKANISVDENQEATIDGISFVCQVENVKSDNRIMNNKTFEALKGDDFPEIKFSSTEKVTVPGATTKTQVKGKLSIAGKTQDITLEFSLENSTQNQVNVTGETKLNMSDFGIEPPTAMLGTLKTGDEITITYNITLQKNNES